MCPPLLSEAEIPHTPPPPPQLPLENVISFPPWNMAALVHYTTLPKKTFNISLNLILPSDFALLLRPFFYLPILCEKTFRIIVIRLKRFTPLPFNPEASLISTF